MIWGVGLPRCGGQSLQTAISILTGKRMWHSIEPHRWHDSITQDDAGATECYAPRSWLKEYPGGPHTFILNDRNKREWLDSCVSVYRESQDKNWNHPIWRYPLEQFEDFYDDWIYYYTDEYDIDIHFVNIVDDPRWGPLCDILQLPIPDEPFPNRDRIKRPGQDESDSYGPQTSNPFNFWDGAW